MSTQTDPLSTPVLTWETCRNADVVIVGAGIAGLAFALRMPSDLSIIVVTKGALGESNTRYAQGGLAAAVGPDDSTDLHFADTIVAGAGLCDHAAVRTLVDEGTAAVKWLVARGTVFDEVGQDGNDHVLALGKEAAHSRNRVLHAGGDATGVEIERSLVRQLHNRPSTRVLEHTAAIDLVTDRGETCRGVIVQSQGSPSRTLLAAPITVLANGGAGQLWAVSSNPAGATGDGIAMGIRAGVAVADLEFTQFHPTVLAADGIEPFLVSEAVRGEGAYLRSMSGERFMTAIHPMAELAPRDVVARAIQAEIPDPDAGRVYLDLRHLDRDLIRRRFPSISERLESHGIDLGKDLIPVAPAAHYFMGGIVAATNGRTSMPGLLAIGEVSCTGVHGANRLASNSLLEGLVFGLRAADFAATSFNGPRGNTIEGELKAETSCEASREPFQPLGTGDTSTRSAINPNSIREAVQETMSQQVAVVRSARSLHKALRHLESLNAGGAPLAASVPEAELRNVLLLAREVTRSALMREESRGGHFRADFPEQSPTLEGRHLIVDRTNNELVRSFATLPDALSAIPHA